jgi:hypothetical protein
MPPEIETSQTYLKWRDMIFTITPGQVGVSNDQPDKVYGVLMDIGLVDQQTHKTFALSLTAFPTGESSFQPTLGGGVIGLGNDEKVAQNAKALVNIAQSLIEKTKSTQDYSLPEMGLVQFFFLTTSGVRVYSEHLNTMQTPGNPFYRMLQGFGFIRESAERLMNQRYAKKGETTERK